ncbi:MAG: AtpZ/AtpI family protein [Flavobacteriales bacterium]|nr:AtpZ/AtpI family protein [Flavobacteriales bacterium]
MSSGDKGNRLRRSTRDYARFSGIGFQMAGIIGLGAYGGWWLDGRTGWKFPVFTLAGSLGGVAAAMWILFKETRTR